MSKIERFYDLLFDFRLNFGVFENKRNLGFFSEFGRNLGNLSMRKKNVRNCEKLNV